MSIACIWILLGCAASTLHEYRISLENEKVDHYFHGPGRVPFAALYTEMARTFPLLLLHFERLGKVLPPANLTATCIK